LTGYGGDDFQLVGRFPVWSEFGIWHDIHLGVDIYDWSKLDAVAAQFQATGAKLKYIFISAF
jgi:hypothetical protein